MDTLDRIKFGRGLLAEGKIGEVVSYIRTLREKDPLAAEVLKVSVAVHKAKSAEIVRKGVKLLQRLWNKPQLAAFLLEDMGMAYRMTGDMERSENCFLRFLELGETIRDPNMVSRARVVLLYNKLFRAEYEALRRNLQKSLNHGSTDIQYLLGITDIIRGNPEQAIRTLISLLGSPERKSFKMGVIEIKGLAERILGNCEEAMNSYLESIRGFLDFGAAYSVFPCAKAINLSRFSGLKPPSKDIVKRCLSLAKGGSWGEQAAADEIRALQLEDENEAAVRLFEAAKDYYRAYQPIEAFLAGLTSAFLAWRSDSPIFPLVLKFLSPLAPLHPGFKQDPFLGEFFQQIEPLITQSAKKRRMERDKGLSHR
ncbi:MAG: hypothetical protein ABIM19_08060 [candidate division WOR-3 bacterium]